MGCWNFLLVANALSFVGSTHFLTPQCLKITKNVAFQVFVFWHFPPIFVLLKVTCLVTLFDHNLQVFKNSPKWTIFGIFNELLSTRNVYVARFARNVECDFFCDFQTPCTLLAKGHSMSRYKTFLTVKLFLFLF